MRGRERPRAECRDGGEGRAGKVTNSRVVRGGGSSLCSCPPSPTDHDLVLRCIQRDEEAWEVFVVRFLGVIQHQVRRFLRGRAVPFHRDDIEDYSHGVFLAFLKDDGRKLRLFEGKCSLTSWVRIVTTHEVIDQLRRERPQVPLDAANPGGVPLRDRLQDPHPTAEENLAGAEERRMLRLALEQQVSLEDRKLAVLSYELEVPVEEIADILRISREAVYTRRHRLQGKLRRILTG
jgi:RNA polymerase sigma factor (sigma-70 family)